MDQKSLPAILALLVTAALFSCSSKEEEVPDYKISLEPVPMNASFVSDSMSIWGGSLVKGEDGVYHMFYARWPRAPGWVWVTHSEIAHAVSHSPFGPFEDMDVSLPDRGPEYWDGMCTHNPTIHKFDGKYYLYYMGNTGDKKVVGVPGREQINWDHRNKQRIGVAVADTPYGPWKRFDKPVLDITHGDSLAHDALMTSNPSICQRPDGGFLMVYKAVGLKYPLPKGGPVVHCIATSDSPTGPFKKHPDPVFLEEGVRFPAEDPYIWYQDGKYRAVVKFIQTEGKKRSFSLVHYDSEDGFKWNKGKFFEISDRTIQWEDGSIQRLSHLERPQVFIENGMPVALLCAADTRDENNVRQSFNVQIPISITKLYPESHEVK